VRDCGAAATTVPLHKERLDYQSRIDQLDAYIFVNLLSLGFQSSTMTITPNTAYDRLRENSRDFAGVDLDNYVECTATSQLAVRPGKEKALCQACKAQKLYRQQRLMAETTERLTTASLQVMAKIPGFLDTLGRWLRSSAGHFHQEGVSPLDLTAIKVAMRLDISNYDRVPVKFRSSLQQLL